jgi:hypothetical protein
LRTRQRRQSMAGATVGRRAPLIASRCASWPQSRARRRRSCCRTGEARPGTAAERAGR